MMRIAVASFSFLVACVAVASCSSKSGENANASATTTSTASSTSTSTSTSTSSGAGAGLVGPADLVYEGAFRVPSGKFGSDANAIFDYSDDGLAYYAAHDSLFIKGHTYGQMVAEISIPAAVKSADPKALPVAKVLQNFAEITEGHIDDEKIQNAMILGGLLVWDQQLIGSIWAYYDGAGQQTKSHFTSGLALATQGDFKGLFTVGDPFPAFVAGYMTRIPDEWQMAFGGPALTGHCCTSIIGHQSWGPAAWVFDPGELGKKSPVPATGVVYYDAKHPTLGSWDNTAKENAIYNMASLATGIVFAPGTKSLLFFGSTGLGVPCYGEGTDDKSLQGKPTPDGSEWCYDPDVSSKGTHGYPYGSYVWAYDANDLVAVKNGTKKPWDVQPYAHWQLKLPIDTGTNQLNGAAYDEKTKRIYLSQRNADGAMPILHVLTLKPGG